MKYYKHVQVRLDDQRLTKFDQMRQKSGLSASQLMRRLIDSAEVIGTPRVVATVAPVDSMGADEREIEIT